MSGALYEGGAGGAAGSGGVNIAASNTTYTSGTVVLSGGANITVSTNGQTVSIIGGAGGAFAAGVSTGGNTLGTTGTVGNQVVLAGGNNVTLSQSTGAGGATVTISVPNTSSQSVQTQNLVDVTLSGNTSGALALISSGTLTLAGGNNITLSQNGNAVTISGGAGGAETQTAISGIVGSNATYTSGTVTFTGVGGGVTVSSNTGQRIDISVAAPVAQTVQTQNLHNVTLSGNTAGAMAHISSGTLTLAGGNNIVLSQAGNAVTISASAQTGTQFVAGLSNIGGTAGDTVTVAGRIIFAGGNNVTLSGSSNGVSQTITISVPNTAAQSVQTQSNIQSIAASDTTYHTGQVQFTGSNMITVKSSANQRIVIDATQSVQTQSRFNLTLSGNSTSGGGGYILVSSGVMTLAGGNNVTLSQDGNAVTISGGAGAGGFAGGGISGGNTAGDTGSVTGRLIFAGGNNVTLSGSTNGGSQTITISGPNTSVHFSAGMSTEGNTAGNTGVTGTRLVLVGSGPISLSQTTGAAGGTLSINGPATTSLSAYSNITLSVDVSTIKFSVANTPKEHVWENFPAMDANLLTHISGISKTPFYWPERLQGPMTLNSVVLRMSNVATATLQSFDVHFGVYTYVNSTSVALLGSASNNFNVSTASSVSFSGQRHYVLTSPSTQTAISNLSEGDYVFGMMFSAGATGSMHQSLYGASNAAGGVLGVIKPGNNQLSTATSQGAYALFGRGSTTVNLLPANVQASELVNQGSAGSQAIQPWIMIRS